MKFDLKYARGVIVSEAENILSMAEMVETAAFKMALELIYKCKGSVVITGLGKAGIIGQKISATMASVGTPSHFLHPVEALHGDLGRVSGNDVLLALSNGGETDEIIRLIDLVKQQEIKLISITGNKDSRLAKYSDAVLCMGMMTEVCPLGLAPSVSTSCMLAIGDALALTVMKAHQFVEEDYAKFHPGGSLGAKLITVGQSMEFGQGDELPIAKVDETLGQMLDETKKVKRRGATMVVDGSGKLVGIITDADFRRLISEKGADGLECAVGDVMTADCKRVTEETLAAEAMAIFHKFRIDDLPVVDADDKPVGMIDVQDIVSIKVDG